MALVAFLARIDMQQEEKEEFHATVSLMAQNIVQMLLKSGLGPMDSAFALGVAAKTITTVMNQIMSVTTEEAMREVRSAMLGGLDNAEVHVIPIDRGH